MRELLRARRRPVHRLVVAEGRDGSPVVAEILDLAREASVPVSIVDPERIAAMSLTDSPQGVIALAGPVPETTLADLMGGGGGPPFLVVLDGVTDPHNLGAVMRSALCAGATGIVVGRRRGAHLTATAVKVAAGAAEHLPVAVVAGIPAALSALRQGGLWTVAVEAGAPLEVWDLPVATAPVALVLGAEGSGLSALARQRCELAASIPMSGPLDSLNVGAAAALACFAVARLRRMN